MAFQIHLLERSKEELMDLIIERDKKIEELERELKKYKKNQYPFFLKQAY
ncbi:hypothetical protein HYX14_02905 [Candidatus Woesearchaeota archaeon]|nr:hypothetical protein [Candidatus Woesearchaeota archaeon]